MRKSFPAAVAAMMLVTLSPAIAANMPKDHAGNMTIQRDAGAAAGAVSPTIDGDGASNVILLDQDSLHTLPNPYSNPEPRMISDVWAMRT